jgi:starch synthase
VEKGKAACKKALQQKMGLPLEPRTPLIGMVTRLAVQKGLDLLKDAGDALLPQDVQLVVLGDGDPVYREMLQALQQRFPRKLAVRFALDEELAHQIEAGADLFLMPSLYEPCGLNQLYSLKYGTVPVVRRTGGLADTVTDATPDTLTAGTATGFAFGPPEAEAMLEALRRALICYHEEPRTWLQIQQTGMRQDWSWGKSAEEYERLYEELSGMDTES